jgi:hypothetical protein
VTQKSLELFGQVEITRDPDSYDPALGRSVRDPTLEPPLRCGALGEEACIYFDRQASECPTCAPTSSASSDVSGDHLTKAEVESIGAWLRGESDEAPWDGRDGMEAMMAALLESHEHWHALAESRASEVARLQEQVTIYKGIAEAAAEHACEVES